MFPAITFIGGGNMACSLIGGLIADGCPAKNITVAEPDADKLAQLKHKLGINTATDNALAVNAANVVILAVKPQVLQTVCKNLAQSLQQHKPLIISIAAGIRSDDIDRWSGSNQAIVRCMPNTPALLRCGVTGLYANANVSNQQRDIAQAILAAAGVDRKSTRLNSSHQ